MVKRCWVARVIVALIILVAAGSLYMLFAGSTPATLPQPADRAREKSRPVKAMLPDGLAQPQKHAPDSEPPVVLQLFFADQAAVQSGQPGAYGLVAPVQRTLPFTEGVLKLALQELIRGPLPSEAGLTATLPQSVRILNLELQGGLALIDLSGEALLESGGGITSAAVFIQSIVLTATQFPTVDAVVVLVEGDPWEDGHYSWRDPISRADLADLGGCPRNGL
ncbi:MAG: GerMN domain-containing protein [Bacillota bacterium]